MQQSSSAILTAHAPGLYSVILYLQMFLQPTRGPRISDSDTFLIAKDSNGKPIIIASLLGSVVLESL